VIHIKILTRLQYISLPVKLQFLHLTAGLRWFKCRVRNILKKSMLCKLRRIYAGRPIWGGFHKTLTRRRNKQHNNSLPVTAFFVYCNINSFPLWLNGKQSKAVPLHAMVALGGRGSIAPTHSWPRHQMGVSGQSHAPAALYPRGNDPSVPIVQEAGWASEPVWTQRLEEKSFAPAGDRTPIARSSSP
jgi:hypothetical protein